MLGPVAQYFERHRRSWLIVVPWVVAGAAFILIAVASDVFQECVHNPYYYASYHKPEKGIAIIFGDLWRTKSCLGEFLIKDGEAITAFFTLALSAWTVGLWWSTRNLWKAARTALTIAERPWVSVEPGIGSGITYNERGEARIVISFIMKNTGRSPATNVDVDAEIVPFMGENGRVAFEDMREISARARSAIEGKRLTGHAVFPGQEFTYSVNLGILRARFENIFRGYPDIGEQRVEIFTPVVVGCVSYRFAFQPGRHVTEFIADLRRIDPPTPMRWVDGNIDANNLVLIKSLIGGNPD
jgi:hypothetical protein